MASSLFSPQSPFFSSLSVPISNSKSSSSSSAAAASFCPRPKNYYYYLFTNFKNSKIPSSNSEENSPEFQDGDDEEEDPVKLAFARAKAYRKSKNTSTTKIAQTRPPLQETPFTVAASGKSSDDYDDDGNAIKEVKVPLPVKLAMEKAKAEYEKTGESLVDDTDTAGLDQKINGGSESNEVTDDDCGQKEVPLAVKLALERAKEYNNKKFKGAAALEDSDSGKTESLASGLKEMKEISPDQDKQSTNKNAGKKEELTVSSLDFMGLGFADKKIGRSLPAGLVPLSDPFPEGDLPEVEILVGDTSKFEDSLLSEPKPVVPAKEEEDDDDLYKPKVSTWGVFPRPSDISKTYGGGKTIRPGDVLETAEERAAKEARTKQLVAAYKRKIGLNIDPKLKSECERALKDGDELMDLGKLKEALPFYEQVMEKLGFQSELHGLAALQWSICVDSLSRPNEARAMYEKLQSHPSPKVSKRARQFIFGFQAMEMMKVSSMNRPSISTGYQDYFEAFLQGRANYAPRGAGEEDDEGLLTDRALPHVIFLLSPILVVLLLAASRSQQW